MSESLVTPPRITLALPNRLDGPGMCRLTDDFVKRCPEGKPPPYLHLDFQWLGFIDPSGVTFLSNFIHWLKKKDVSVYFVGHNSNREVIKFLDDSLFFEQHTGNKINVFSSPRSTTQPLQRVDQAKSHAWLRGSLVPWLIDRIGYNKATFHSIQVCVSEIFNNIDDHANQPNGSIFIQHFPRANKLSISIGDFGRGIPTAVRTVRPELSDVDAIKLAVADGFTTKSNPSNQGAGLDYLLTTITKTNGGTVTIYSLTSYVEFSPNGIRTVSGAGFCPGTTIDISLRTDTIVMLDDEPEDLEW